MEAVGATAGIIAIIRLVARTVLICLEYSRAVKTAKKNIFRLHIETKSLEQIFYRVKELCDQEDDRSLWTSQETLRTLNNCFT